MVYRAKEDVDKALEYSNKSMLITLGTLGPNHPLAAHSYNNMAVAYRTKGELDTALEFYNVSLFIRVNTLGKDHSDIAGSYNNIAMIYRDQGELDKALEYYHASLAIKIKTLGEQHAMWHLHTKIWLTSTMTMGSWKNLRNTCKNQSKFCRKH